VERTYRFILRDRYLQVTSRSTYPPQEKNPAGEVHEEMGVVSFDKGRGAFVFRQFHGEGFVNQYVAETVADTEIVFATEVIENIAPDWRARETYLRSGPDAFGERFELAATSKTATSTRIGSAGSLSCGTPPPGIYGATATTRRRVVPLSPAAALLLLGATVVVLGINWPIMKTGLESIEPMWFAFLRVLSAGVVVATAAAATGRLRPLPR
jgi:hypothetical protein